MGDIAFVFGWTLDKLERMSVADLMIWRGEAVRRHDPERHGS